MRIVRITFFIALVLVVASIAFLWIYSRTLQPEYDGKLSLPNLENEVVVFYDEYGIPHIYGLSDTDVYYAMGYVHAQDRLFQMDLLRRVGGGRLAEFFGESVVEVDRLFHTLGVPEFAQQSVSEMDRLSPELKRIVNSYLKGVNHYVDHGSDPLEYLIAGLPKEHFTEVDIYHIAGYMAFSFALGLRTDPLVQNIHDSWGTDYLNDLALQHYPEQELAPSGRKRGSEPGFSRSVLSVLDSLPIPVWMGSNNWAVAGEHTKSGKPILANDTHIKYSQPSTWYETHLEYPGHMLYGNFLAGIPLALIGHNNHLAWGITMFENDDTDFYFEEIHPDNSELVRYRDSLWMDIEQRQVIIKVKGGATDTLVIRSTPHGPIVNEFFEQSFDRPVSLFWTYTQKENNLPTAFQRLNYAQNIDEARAAIQLIHAPGLNFAYADTDNNIALWSAAHLIERPPHVNSKLILNGASGKDEPMGYYPFDANPNVENPPNGFVYSANSQHDTTQYGVMHPGYYTTNLRMQRIAELLGENNIRWDVEQMKAVSTDHTSKGDARLGQHLYTIIQKKGSKDQIDFFAPLADWKGDHELGSRLPVLYYPLVYHLLQETFADELGEEQFDQFLTTHLMKRSLYRTFYLEESVWFNNVHTSENEDKSTIVLIAAQKAMDQLKSQHPDLVFPTWGEVHTIEFEHPMAAQPPLNMIFNVGPFPIAGTNESVNQQSFKQNDQGKYPVLHGPQMRILIDMGDMENSISINPTGQSGNVLSDYYSNQAEKFVNCDFRPQLTNRKQIETSAAHKLVFQPE